ncbi:MAG TPA: DUF559 domain-containing protein [Acidimicrobiales bacterium]|nr:DUF559 domain-containing protein [Acidimicrobiales bacterium]
MEIDLAPLAEHAAAHHGLFRATDAGDRRISREQIRSLLRRGWCAQIVPGVYRVVAAPRTGRQALLAEIWSHPVGTIGSHRGAGFLWWLVGYRSPSVEVTFQLGHNQRNGRRTHASLWLPASHVTVHDSIPVTTVARTLFDLAGLEPRGRVAIALDDALSRKLCTLRQINQVFFALAGRGRRGTVAMREMLEKRGEDYVPPSSALERLARKVFEESGLEMPTFELNLGDDDWIGRVDCVWRDAKLIVELDSERYHGSKSARDADRKRDNRLMATGWRVLRITWDDLKLRPQETVAQIKAALRAAR